MKTEPAKAIKTNAIKNPAMKARAAPSSTASQLRSRLQHHREMAGDSLHRLWKAPLSSLMTITVIGIALLLPALLAVVMQNVGGIGSGIDDINQITLYLHDEVSESAASEISDDLLSKPDVRAVSYISADQALLEFREQSGFGDVINALGSNPLPAALVIRPSTLTAAEAEQLLQELQAMPEVEFAQLDLQWLQRLQALTGIIERAVAALILILSIAVLFVVGNTIRMAIESRRAEILVVKLVGGSNSFVARPFLYTGFWYGLLGGLFAWLSLLLLLLLFSGPLSNLLDLYSSDFVLQGPGALPALVLLCGGALLGWLGALLSVMQYLAAIEPR
jgi:cell division transport system permease protein